MGGVSAYRAFAQYARWPPSTAINHEDWKTLFGAQGYNQVRCPLGQNFVRGVSVAADIFWHRFSAISAAPPDSILAPLFAEGKAFCNP